MGRTAARKKRKPAKAKTQRSSRRGVKRYNASDAEMEDNFYMYSSDDLPEIENDLGDTDVKPEISRDYYL